MLCTFPESFHHFDYMKVRRLLRAVSFGKSCKISCKIPCLASYFAAWRPVSRRSFARDNVIFDLAALGCLSSMVLRIEDGDDEEAEPLIGTL